MMPKEAPRRRGAIGAALAVVAVVLVALVATGGSLLPASGVVTPASTVPGSPGPAPSAASAATRASPSAATLPSPSDASPSAATAPPTATPSAIPADRLQATLDKVRAKLGIPGVSVAIVWDDGRRWLGASGLRDVAARDPMTTDTGFALASISKTFTAAVVLQLVEEGRLRLDQPVAPLLPAFGLDRRITVRMLLDHTSGLPDFFFGKGIDAALQARPGATWTAARSWSFVPAKHAVPGRSWYYSNTNYLLLGELVTAVTGNPVAVEIRRRLLDPLGLGTAWYQAVETPRVTGTLAYRLVAKPGGGVRPVLVARAIGRDAVPVGGDGGCRRGLDGGHGPRHRALDAGLCGWQGAVTGHAADDARRRRGDGEAQGPHPVRARDPADVDRRVPGARPFRAVPGHPE